MMIVTSLFMSLIAVTQATNPVKDVAVSPLSDPVIIFDVITEAPAADVISALNGIKVYHRFKVVGVSRYIFVTSGSDTQAMADLQFPEGSAVTQIPAEHRDDFNKMFGVDHGWKEEYVLEKLAKHKLLAFVSWELHFPPGTTVDEYNSQMAQAARRMADLQNATRPVAYAALATYPTQLLYFADIESNVVQYVVRDDMASLGGPGIAMASFQRIVII